MKKFRKSGDFLRFYVYLCHVNEEFACIGMNKKQKFLASFATLIVVYIIVLLFIPGWETSKILGILAGVCSLIGIYGTYKTEEKK